MLLPSQMTAETTCPGLPAGHRLLHGQYQIEAGLNEGGFGRTYVARDSLDRRGGDQGMPARRRVHAHLCGGLCPGATAANVCFARSCAVSCARHSFWRARTTAILWVCIRFSGENGTAYIAMDHAPGHDLHTVRTAAETGLSPQELFQIMRQGLEALDCLHGLSILHHDISPDNFLWDRADVASDTSGHLTLIDFGAARLCDAPRDAETVALPATVKDGYSAPELYDQLAVRSPASDLYAFGATLELLITGTPPEPADLRVAAVAKGQPDPRRPLVGGRWPLAEPFLALIDKALCLLPEARFETAAQWLQAMPRAADVAMPATRAEQANPLLPTGHTGRTGRNLSSRIAHLVAETNAGLTPHLPRALQPPPKPKAKPRRGPMVDLFGNPIEDLESWLLAQNLPRRLTVRPPVPNQDTAPNTPSFEHRLERLKARTEPDPQA